MGTTTTPFEKLHQLLPGSDRRYGVTAGGRTSSMPQGVEGKKTNFKITLNFEHYVVLISHLGAREALPI